MKKLQVGEFKKRNKVKLGLLKNRQMKINDDFKMTAEELLNLLPRVTFWKQ